MAFSPETTTVYQNVNIGKQSTMGTPVTAGTHLQSVSIQASPKIETQPFTPEGSLLPTLVTVGKDMTEFKLEGSPVYEELDWVVGSVLCAGNAGVYNPSMSSTNTPDFYTFQFGQSGQCYSVPDAVLTSLECKFSRSKIEISGSGIGGKMVTGTWNAAATTAAASALNPVLPQDVSITLGGTTLTRSFDVNLSIANRWKDVWAVNKAATSYVNVVETVPTINVKMVMEVDAAFNTILNDMRSTNTTKILQINAASASESWLTEIPVKVASIDEFKDQDGVYAVSVTFQAVNNGTYGIKMTIDSTP